MIPKTTLEILVEGRELISDPARWTKKKLARNAKGISVKADDADAQCWCSLGALIRVGGSYNLPAKFRLDAAIMESNMDSMSFNDTHTHAEVLAMWDRAIATCNAEVNAQ